jgi:hypothetical protein
MQKHGGKCSCCQKAQRKGRQLSQKMYSGAIRVEVKAVPTPASQRSQNNYLNSALNHNSVNLKLD